MARKPLTLNAGKLEQLPDGAILDVGGWYLPAAGGTVLFVLMADGSGNAIWAQVDHGDTTGRSDDDHTLYHTDARGDARYYTETELDAGQLDNRYFTEAEHLDSSAGAGDSGKPIKLDAGGHVDATMLNDGDIDHGSIGGLTDDDHAGYVLVDGSRALGGDWSLGGFNLTSVGLFGGVDVSEMNSFFNGTFQETFDALVTSDGATITMSLEQSGTGDLTMQFSDGYTTLDCTDPLQTIALTAGTDISPQANYIYIPQSTKVLTKSTVTWPAGECIRVAYFLVPSATFVNVHGCYINQNWNDHLTAANSQGHMPHMSEKLRRLGASWFSGVSANGATASYFTIGFNTTDWLSTEGEVDQLHEHTFPAVETSGSDTVLVVNQSGAAYDDIYDLYSITDDNTGTTISNNRYFNLVFWGVVNKGGEFSALMVNLPGGFYVLASDAAIDANGYDVYDIPREFSIDSGTAFLICRSTFKMGSTWTHVATVDLRGKSPNNAASGSSVNDHGGLGGLTDDDHGGYHTDGRADTWLAAGHETTYAHANYDTAYGWGDHASGGYLKADGSVALTAHWVAGAFNITGLALLTVDNITIDAATIVSDTGAISFNDENVSTSGTMVGSNIPSPSADDQVLIATASGVAVWSTASDNQILASNSDSEVAWVDKGGSDYTCFMSLAGNDSTGDGTHGDPWLTFAKCLIEIEARYFVASDTATIHIEPGDYIFTGNTIPALVPKIVVTADSVHSKAMSDIVAVTNVAGDVWDVEIQLDNITNLTTDMYGLITQGSDLPVLNGCWEVRAFDATGTDTVTLRIHYEDLLSVGPPVAGADTATIYFPTVTLTRTGDNLFIQRARDFTISNMVLVGTAEAGIYARVFTRSYIGNYVGVTGFAYGIRGYEQSAVEVRNSAVSLCTQGMFVDAASHYRTYNSSLSGCSQAFNVSGSSFLYVDLSYISSNTYGFLMQYGSSVRVANTTFSTHSTAAIRAQYASFVHATGSCVFTDNNDDFQPNVDVQGNDNSWITR